MSQSWGLTAAALTLAATLSPVANGASRISWGWASDRLGRENTMAIAFLLQALCLVMVVGMGHVSGGWFTLSLVLVYFTWGEIYSLFPSTVGDYFGSKHATSNYSVLYTAKGVASIIGGWFGAMLYEQTGSWSGGFYGSAIMALIAAGLALSSPVNGGDRQGASRRAGDGEVANRHRMSSFDVKALAQELASAYANRQPVNVLPSARDSGFALNDAYAVEAELARLRRADGHHAVGRKIGYANKAMWRVLKLDTLVWAHMYNDTVHHAQHGLTTISVERMYSPKIEPEIVFKLKAPLEAEAVEPAAALEGVEWLALGFEIIDCVYPGWTYQPADFVAAYGLHAALIVGTPLRIEPAMIPALVDDLSRFTVRLMRNGELVEEGSGKNVLRSPARSLGELAAAISRTAAAEPLAAGELVSSGTLTTSTPIAPGEQWQATVDGLPLAGLTLQV